MEKKEELQTALYMLVYLKYWIKADNKIPQKFMLDFISEIIGLIEETIQSN